MGMGMGMGKGMCVAFVILCHVCAALIATATATETAKQHQEQQLQMDDFFVLSARPAAAKQPRISISTSPSWISTRAPARVEAKRSAVGVLR